MTGKKVLIGLVRFVSVMYLILGVVEAQGQEPPGTDSTYVHDPYDISNISVLDSTDVYKTQVNHFWRLPQYAWSALVHPLGEFTIYAEHARLWVRYFDFFTNEDGTIGVFPVLQIGGETGHGGGAQFFHTNLFGRRKILTGQFVYSGRKGQWAEGQYVHPRFGSESVTWRINGSYLKTRHREANINAALDDSNMNRLFRLTQFDFETHFDWQQHTGPKQHFVPQFKMSGWVGFSKRSFHSVIGGGQQLNDPGSSPQARLLKGLGQDVLFYRLGGHVMIDNRDYREPASELVLPVHYQIPGRIVEQFDERYYFYRDLGYPERGGFALARAEVATSTEGVKFYRLGAELAHYLTLFWQDRILALRASMDKVTSWGNGYVPYTDLVQMGGNEIMRGYERGYFRGQGSLVLQAEYRYPIWDTWNAFLFWDEGQNFDHYADLTWGQFHSCWGGGISFRTELGLLGKIKIGHSSAEKMLIGFTFRQAF